MDLTNFFRTTNTGFGIGSNFGATPYNTSIPASKLTEDHFSLQNSRILLRVDSNVAGGTAVGYLETDFLGNSATGIFVTSNSYTLRLRLYFLDYHRGNWEILGGQDWSMLTANRNGIGFMPGDIFYSQDMDTNYQAGLVWERTPQFRVVYHPNKTAALGLSIENSEQYVGGSFTNATSTTTPAAAIVVPAGFNTGQVDINGNSSGIPAVAPDLIGKIALDPMVSGRDFHFEIAGEERQFKVNTILSNGVSINDSATGAGAEFNMNLEFFKNFHFIENAYWSNGGGRLIGNSLVPDFIIRPQATPTSPYTISPVHASSGILGFEWQANPMHMIYGYFSTVYVSQNLALGTAAQCGPLLACGYGVPGASATTAQLANRNIQEATLGYIPKFWTSPNYGTLQLITQFSYLLRSPWYVPAGAPRMGHLFMTYIDLRYVLP